MVLMQTVGLSVRFGGVQAVNDVSMRVMSGQVVGLIGPNGAGKTTFIDAITGTVAHTGRIEFDGDDISKLPAHRRPQLGVGRTWQSVALFGDLTVRENLAVSKDASVVGSALRDVFGRRKRLQSAQIDDALERLGIGDIGDRYPHQLSQGHRKLAGLARALVKAPKLLCMDEPAAGLDTGESLALGQNIRSIVASGISALLVEHDMGLVMRVCDYVYVLEFGRLIAQGVPSDIRRDERVLQAYLGTRKLADSVLDEVIESQHEPGSHPTPLGSVGL